MTPRTSWRARLPDLAALLDDPRVQAVLIEPSGPADVRDAAGERLDLWLPPPAPALLRSLTRSPRALDDEGFVFTSIACASGPALYVRRRAGDDQLGLPAELAHLIGRSLALGVSMLVVAPTVGARALGASMLARAARGRRLLALPAAADAQALTVEPAAVESLAVDHALLLAGELGEGAGIVLRSGVPCIGSVAGLDLESGVARLLGRLASETPGAPHATLAGWVARRFDLVLELDAHKVVALAEVHAAADGALTTLRLMRRAADGAFEVDLLGSRIEHLLGTDVPRPKLSVPGIGPTTVARPPARLEPEPLLPSDRPRPSEVSRTPVIVRAGNGGRTYPVRRSDAPPPLTGARLDPPLRPARGSSVGPPPSSRLMPLVDPPPLGAGPHRAAVSGHSGIRADLAEAADLATATAPPLGRVGLDDLSELTADQLVSHSFIVDVGAPPPDPEDEASAAGILAFDDVGRDLGFDEHTASGLEANALGREPSRRALPEVGPIDRPAERGIAERAPLERLSTEVADGSHGSLLSPLPSLVIGGGGGDETMQIPAKLLRPPSSLLIEASAELDAPVEPSPLDDEDRAGRTAMGTLAQDEGPPPARPATGRPRIRRAKP